MEHTYTFTQLSLSIILSSLSVVYIIVVLGLFFFVPCTRLKKRGRKLIKFSSLSALTKIEEDREEN